MAPPLPLENRSSQKKTLGVADLRRTLLTPLLLRLHAREGESAGGDELRDSCRRGSLRNAAKIGTTPASRTTEPVPPESVKLKPHLGAPRDTSSGGTTRRQGCTKPTQGPPVTLDSASPLASAKQASAKGRMGTCSLLLFSGTLGPPSDQARLACQRGAVRDG